LGLRQRKMHSVMTRVISDLKQFESLSATWDSLLSECQDDNSMFLSYEWLWTWWRYFGDGKKLNILLIEKREQVIGIVPLMKVEYRVGLVKFHFLETIGSTNCNYIWLTKPESRQEVMTAVLAYLEEELTKNKLTLRLTLVPGDSKFRGLLHANAPVICKELVVQDRITTSAPYITLPTTFDEYFRSLSQKMRKKLRRASRSLEKSHIIEYKQLNADSIEEGLNTFFDLHQRRWQAANIRGMFSIPEMEEFYREIARRFLRKNWLHFSCLTVDNEMASAEYGFVYNGKLYELTAARNIRYAEYSTGHLHALYLVKDAISNSLREIDLLKGEEPYKFYWTKSTRKYAEIIVTKRGYVPSLRIKLIRIFLRLYQVRQYTLREIYSLLLIKRREKNDKKKMRLDKHRLL